MTGAPAACEIHKTHSPANLSTEFHHVLPVSWQLQPWKPEHAPFPGKDPSGRGLLWDDRGVTLCPTGHRNVHVWIVRLMKALAGGEDPQQAFAAVKGNRGGAQAATALLALTRFKEAGGLLQQLVAAHEWGIS